MSAYAFYYFMKCSVLLVLVCSAYAVLSWNWE
jgi:hypothetical protein